MSIYDGARCALRSNGRTGVIVSNVSDDDTLVRWDDGGNNETVAFDSLEILSGG
ncbi:hypothetical protein [Mycobacteroides abscessus]|uniref:hypothetical protein n=1 Tax=Mycobacteroides abscessus TaxID=36809 RepID=UPI0019D2A426|nr:hypothetical protein [Mycobacteroides abscessus]MBN7296591.1 hypothetical protein [Mycobacteroides abscessus subsp. abscessus]